MNKTDPSGHRSKGINWKALGKALGALLAGLTLKNAAVSAYDKWTTNSTRMDEVNNERDMINNFVNSHGPETDMTRQYDYLRQSQISGEHAAGQLGADAANDYYNNFPK